jgi:hypothetical protein
MAIGKWGISFSCGAFFCVQPLLIAAERRMNLRRWRLAAARIWTLAALTITSPLFVEPALQIIESSWGTQHSPLGPTVSALVFVMGLCGLICGVSTLSVPEHPVDDLEGKQPGAASDAVS